MRTGTYLIQRREIGNSTHASDTARMGDGGADIVDQLLFDKLFAVPDAVENFPYRNRRDRMLADQAEAFLVFSRGRIFHPEQTVLLDAFAETGRFNWRQTVVHIVQKMFVETKLVAHGFKQCWREIEVFLR